MYHKNNPPNKIQLSITYTMKVGPSIQNDFTDFES